MEELQSTELLDREILEDARKKANRILKAADDTIQAKQAEANAETAAALKELEEQFAARNKTAADEIMAFLPIDKHRIKAARIEEQLRSAVETWYSGLSRQQVLDLLAGELSKRIAECEQAAAFNEARVRIFKIEQAEAESILQKVISGKTWRIETMQSAAMYPEIILETPHLRIYASIGKTVEFYLGEKRAELVEALLGKTAMEEAS